MSLPGWLSEPEFQNIPPPRTPEGNKLRALLREEREKRHGKIIVNVDFSAIEMRVAEHYYRAEKRPGGNA